MKNHRIVFVCLTPYQLFITFSYLHNMEKHKNKFDIYIIIVKGINGVNLNYEQLKGVKIIEIPELFTNSIKRYWKRIYYGGRFFGFSILADIITTKTILLIFNDTEPISWKLMMETKKMNGKIILIDEGIGLYNFTSNKKDNSRAYIKYILTKLIGNEIKFQPIGMSPEIDTIIAKEPHHIPESKVNNKKVVRQSYEMMFSKDNVKKFIELYEGYELIKQYSFQNKSILFIDQPISENIYPINSLINEKSFILKILDLMPRNYKIIIKPHPRDNLSKYDEIKRNFQNVTVINGSLAILPIECLLALFQNTTIVTFSSSAGVNAKYINKDIRVCFIYELFYTFLRQLKCDINEVNYNSIKEQMGHNCIIAKDIDEMLDFISNNNNEIIKKEDNNIIRDFEDIEYLNCLLESY